MTYDENTLREQLEKTLLFTPEYVRTQRVIDAIIKNVAVLEDERKAAKAARIDQKKFKTKLHRDLRPINFTVPHKANVADIIANHVRELEEA